MKKIIEFFVVLSMLGVVSAETCDIPGSGCNEQDWGSPNCLGGYDGFDGVGCSGVSMVVAPGNCDGSDTWASVDTSAGTVKVVVTSDYATWNYCQGYGHLAVNWISVDNGMVQVRYLDGFDNDAFDVYLGSEKICSITMLSDGKETWETAECQIPTPAPEPAAILLALALASPAFAYLTLKKRE